MPCVRDYDDSSREAPGVEKMPLLMLTVEVAAKYELKRMVVLEEEKREKMPRPMVGAPG